MWHIFGGKHSEEADFDGLKPDLDLLNDNYYKCEFCDAVRDISEGVPLSITKCPNCGSSNFIPYRLKNYWLYQPLGGGGMGSVYKAMHRDDPRREYAVKVLPREKTNDQHLIESLFQEATIGKAFGRHPHIVAVADYGRYQDEYFVALEFCPGSRLDQIIDDLEININQKYVVLWALQLLSAEQHIYKCGYLYRDMKPQNIMISPDKKAKLFDFGLCIKIEDATDQGSDMIDGSPLYMPPERIVGMPENMSSEIYSLGMVMFHALARKTYYSATDAFELARKHVASLRTSSVGSKLPSYVSPAIIPVLDKMVVRSPDRRYQTFKEVAEALKDVYGKLH